MRRHGIVVFMLRERWLTLKDAADRLGVSRTTLFRMLRRGELGTIRRGRFRLVSERSIRDRLARPEARFPAYTEDHPFRNLVGKFRSEGEGPGSSDKYKVLFGSGGSGSGRR
ncbi:MAG: helix-turn-helix domain-containing protein [Deltaproteobacteria bacterium]|nr:helix-turn-helix domain-containing protein [Deltaproteobacteria bacterium]